MLRNKQLVTICYQFHILLINTVRRINPSCMRTVPSVLVGINMCRLFPLESKELALSLGDRQKKNIEVPSNSPNRKIKKDPQVGSSSWSITRHMSLSGWDHSWVLKRTRWWDEGVFSQWVSDRSFFWERWDETKESRSCFLLPQSFIYVRLSSHWALTDGDYARLDSSAQVSCGLIFTNLSGFVTALCFLWSVNWSPRLGEM